MKNEKAGSRRPEWNAGSLRAPDRGFCAPEKRHGARNKWLCGPGKGVCARRKGLCARHKGVFPPRKGVCAPRKRRCAHGKSPGAPHHGLGAPRGWLCAPRKRAGARLNLPCALLICLRAPDRSALAPGFALATQVASLSLRSAIRRTPAKPPEIKNRRPRAAF